MTSQLVAARVTIALGRACDTDAYLIKLRLRLNSADVLAAGHVVTCDSLAVDVDSEPRWCEIADVIVLGAIEPAAASGPWWAEVLDRYPGCAVTTAMLGPGECVAATRDHHLVRFTTHPPEADPYLTALLCGSFTYGWLCADGPAIAAPRAMAMASLRSTAQ